MNEIIEKKSILYTCSDIYINRAIVDTQCNYHSHNFIEIAYVKSGMGYHVINGEKFFVHGGDIAIIDYNISHKFICSEKHLDIINCIFKPSLYFKATENFKSFSDLLNTYIFMPFSDFSFKNFTITHFSGNDKMLIDNIFDKIFYEYTIKNTVFYKSCAVMSLSLSHTL